MRRNLVSLSIACVAFILILCAGAFASAPPESTSNLHSTGENRESSASQARGEPQATSRRGLPLESRPFETFALGVRASSLGIGIETATPLTRRSNLRFGFNMFNYDRTFDKDGIVYGGTLKLQSAQALFDFFPVRWFHLSPGVLVYNRNELTANASVPGGRTFTLGNFTYFSDPTSPLTGTGKLEVNRAAPLFVVGFGNLVPRTRHFSVSVDLGIAYHGTPKTSLDLSGRVCDLGVVICRDVLTDSSVQGAIQDEVNKLNDLAYPYKFWPIVSVGVGYKF